MLPRALKALLALVALLTPAQLAAAVASSSTGVRVAPRRSVRWSRGAMADADAGAFSLRCNPHHRETNLSRQRRHGDGVLSFVAVWHRSRGQRRNEDFGGVVVPSPPSSSPPLSSASGVVRRRSSSSLSPLRPVRTFAPPTTENDDASLSVVDKRVLTSAAVISQGITASTGEDVIIAAGVGDMTVKELKSKLRERGAKVSGNKRELVNRLLPEIFRQRREEEEEEDEHQPARRRETGRRQPSPQPNQEGNDESLPESVVWRSNRDEGENKGDEKVVRNNSLETLEILQSELHFPDFNNTVGNDNECNPYAIYLGVVELPLASGLLFVNKPAGVSTLPTKSDVDGVSCLSDLVNQWLRRHPEGQDRMRRAREDEELWISYLRERQQRRITPDEDDTVNELLRKMTKRRRRKPKKGKRKESSSPYSSRDDDDFEPRPVHRLDVDTSGVVCVALTRSALRASSMMFERKSRSSLRGRGEGDGRKKASSSPSLLGGSDDRVGIVSKRYTALVEGTLGGIGDASTAKTRIGERGAASPSETMGSTGVVDRSIGKVWIEGEGRASPPPPRHGVARRESDSRTGDGNDGGGGHHEWACDVRGDGTLPFRRSGDGAIGNDDGESGEEKTTGTTADELGFVPGSVREALTSYRVVEGGVVADGVRSESAADGTAATRVELTPHTGRGRQLRLHMASIGHPILGDAMHGRTMRPPGASTVESSSSIRSLTTAGDDSRGGEGRGRLCLHASQLSIDARCFPNCKSNQGIRSEDWQRCCMTVTSLPPF